MPWIRKTNPETTTPIDRYYAGVYCPFVGSTILLCNNCEHVLACTFAALELPYKRRTLGRKIRQIEDKRSLFERLIGSEQLAVLLDYLGKTNEYFQLAKHAHLVADSGVGDNQDLMDPDFDFDGLDLRIADVSTLDVITLTPRDRKSISHHVGNTLSLLWPLKRAAEEYAGQKD